MDTKRNPHIPKVSQMVLTPKSSLHSSNLWGSSINHCTFLQLSKVSSLRLFIIYQTLDRTNTNPWLIEHFEFLTIDPLNLSSYRFTTSHLTINSSTNNQEIKQTTLSQKKKKNTLCETSMNSKSENFMLLPQ